MDGAPGRDGLDGLNGERGDPGPEGKSCLPKMNDCIPKADFFNAILMYRTQGAPWTWSGFHGSTRNSWTTWIGRRPRVNKKNFVLTVNLTVY